MYGFLLNFLGGLYCLGLFLVCNLGIVVLKYIDFVVYLLIYNLFDGKIVLVVVYFFGYLGRLYID